MRKYYEMTFTPCVQVEMKNFNKKMIMKKIKSQSFNIYVHSWEIFEIVHATIGRSSSFCLLVSQPGLIAIYDESLFSVRRIL